MLDRLPLEIFDRILLRSDPIDLARLSLTARFAHHQIFGSINRQRLWYQLFLNHFDDPLLNPESRSAFLNHPSTIQLTDHPSLDPANPSQIKSTVDWLKTLILRIIFRQTLSTTEDDILSRRLRQNYPGSKINDLYSLIFLIIKTAQLSPSVGSNSPFDPYQSLNLSLLEDLLESPPVQFRILHFSGLHSQNQALYASRGSLNDPQVIASAKLHTIYGLTSLDLEHPRMRGIARESCYALANYSADNFYGPFMPDRSCRVNWSHLEALSLVVGLNLDNIRKETTPIQTQSPSTPPPRSPNLPVDPPPFTMPNTIGYHSSDSEILQHQGQEPEIESHPVRFNPHQLEEIPWPILDSLHSVCPFTQIMHPDYDHPAYRWPPSSSSSELTTEPQSVDLNHYDWAGVSGKWLRVVCFLDYRDLHAYNFTRPWASRLDNHTEAVRMMTLELKVVSIGTRPNERHPSPVDASAEFDEFPPIYFEGTLAYNMGASSVPIQGQTLSLVRGCVSMTADSEVRWSVISTLGGADRWSSEGIQVGGIRSKWGVLGTWTEVDRNILEGPIGPFYFYKTAY